MRLLGKYARLKSILLVAGAAFVAGFPTYLLLVNQESVAPQVVNENLNSQGIKAEISHADQIIDKCKEEVHCAYGMLMDMSKTEKQDTVLLTFKDLISKYNDYGYPCHETVHHLGMFLYDYVGDLTRALSYTEQKCGGAVYHGLFQQFFVTKRLSNTDSESIDITKLCPQVVDNPYDIERWQCLHGIGHGLTLFYDNDVFAAVQKCDELEREWEQISCYKGVFMQNAMSYLEKGVGTFDKDDILFPCNSVDPKYAPACYHYHATYILKQKNGDAVKSFKECDKIVPEEFIKYCYHGMGRQGWHSTEGEMTIALAICQAGQPAYQTDCFRGMVMIIVNRDRNTDLGFEFCKYLPEKFKADCYDALGKWVYMLHSTTDGRAKECAKAESKAYFEICMKADRNLTFL